MGIFPPPFLRYNKLKQTVENWNTEEIISEKKVGKEQIVRLFYRSSAA